MNLTRIISKSRISQKNRNILKSRRLGKLEVDCIYLSWTGDPTTSITIHCHSTGTVKSPLIYYKKSNGLEWKSSSEYSTRQFPGTKKKVLWIELNNLTPDTDYEFYINENQETVYRFKTMPLNLERPVKVIFGGDMYGDYKDMDDMNDLAAQQDPDLIVLGGDWAYADSLVTNAWKWEDLWYSWTKRMVDSKGRIIPVIPAIGNHEVLGGYGTKEDVLFFYEMFAFPQKGYGVVDFGDYLSIIILDTAHSNPVASQNNWLQNTLDARRNVKHLIPSYHVPAYPSGRSFNTGVSKQIRDNWTPKFEEMDNIKLIFEHHDHTYKRTHPIKNNRVDPNGIVYHGDGNWGVSWNRDVLNYESTWFLEKSHGRRYLPSETSGSHELDGGDADRWKARHFVIVTFEKDKRTIESMNYMGEVFHSHVQEAL